MSRVQRIGAGVALPRISSILAIEGDFAPSRAPCNTLNGTRLPVAVCVGTSVSTGLRGRSICIAGSDRDLAQDFDGRIILIAANDCLAWLALHTIAKLLECCQIAGRDQFNQLVSKLINGLNALISGL